MKKTNSPRNIIEPLLALVMIALASPVAAQIDPETGTGIVNGYRIGPSVDLSGIRFRKPFFVTKTTTSSCGIKSSILTS